MREIVIFPIYQNYTLALKGKFSSGREGALASKFNYNFKYKQLSEVMLCIYFWKFSMFIWVKCIQKQQKYQ